MRPLEFRNQTLCQPKKRQKYDIVLSFFPDTTVIFSLFEEEVSSFNNKCGKICGSRRSIFANRIFHYTSGPSLATRFSQIRRQDYSCYVVQVVEEKIQCLFKFHQKILERENQSLSESCKIIHSRSKSITCFYKKHKLVLRRI